MLHRLELSPHITGPLTEAIRIQFRLLRYAAQTTAFDQEQCARFINDDAELQGRGEAVARWVAAADKTRWGLLDGFAAHPDEQEKQRWAKLLEDEAFSLLNAVPHSLTAVPEVGPDWQIKGAGFLRQFYEAFSGSGFPGDILGRASGRFGRQEFLKAFEDANRNLYVCASCDEARVGTRHNGRIHAPIDHFFPKSIYPHLSIHPYNLVPVCNSCNSGIKGSIDPLANDPEPRLSPEHLALPYRQEAGLTDAVLLTVDLDAWRRYDPPFKLQLSWTGTSQSQIDGLDRVWEIPSRWNQRGTTDEIGETLFRRLEQFLRAHPGLLDGQTKDEVLRKKIDEFLGVLRDENMRRDPLSFAMTWLLAGFAESPDTGEGIGEALMSELRNWAKAPRMAEDRVNRGAELREVVRRSRVPQVPQP